MLAQELLQKQFVFLNYMYELLCTKQENGHMWFLYVLINDLFYSIL